MNRIFLSLLMFSLTFIFFMPVNAGATPQLNTWIMEDGARISSNGVSPCINYRNDVYYMYYTATGNIVLAASTDGFNFTYQSEIIPAPATNPCVIQLTDGRFRMYYNEDTGGGAPDRKVRVKSAISSDGISFTIESGYRYNYEDHPEDSGQEGVPEVIRMPDGTYWMYFTYGFYTDNSLRAAISTDGGWTFTRQDLTGFGQNCMDPNPIIISESPLQLKMFYSTMNESMLQVIKSAVSTDGINWTIDSGNRIEPTLPDTGVGDPYTLYLPDSNYRMYFFGMEEDGSSNILSATCNPAGYSHSIKIESTNNIPIVAERAMYWDSAANLPSSAEGRQAVPNSVEGSANNVHWTGGHNSNSAVSPSTTWYLAEGCTNGFDEWILIMNPNAGNAVCQITFMDEQGNAVEKNITVNAASRYTLNVKTAYPEMDNKSFSAKVESTNGVGIVVERAMYWGAHGGHNSTGVTSTATKWYLAEGSTLKKDGNEFFGEWILIMNPNAGNAACQLTFMDGEGNTVEKNITVNAASRYTLNVKTTYPEMDNKSFSTKVESTNGVGIVVERAMYWGNNGQWAEGHCDTGIIY